MSDSGKSEETIFLQKGKAAPFNGKLMPDYQWMEMNVDLMEGDLCKAELKDCAMGGKSADTLTMLIIGFAAGMATTYLIRR